MERSVGSIWLLALATTRAADIVIHHVLPDWAAACRPLRCMPMWDGALDLAFFMFCIRAALARVAAIRFPNGAGRAGRDRDIREEVLGSMMWSRNPLRRCLG